MVRKLENHRSEHDAGFHQFSWNGKDGSGHDVASVCISFVF